MNLSMAPAYNLLVWKQLKSAIKREYKHTPTNTSSEPA